MGCCEVKNSRIDIFHFDFDNYLCISIRHSSSLEVKTANFFLSLQVSDFVFLSPINNPDLDFSEDKAFTFAAPLA